MEIFKILGLVSINNKEANKSLDEVNKKAEKVSKELEKKFESIGKGFTKIGEKMTKTGTVLTATLTTGIAGLTAVGIKYNTQMEDFQMNLTTLLGSSDKANKLLKDLKEMAATTPFETSDLINATQTMIGFNIGAKESQEYLSMLGDVAMGNKEKLQGLSLAFAQVQSTGKLTGQDLMQMINQGFNPLPYICKKTGESMSQVKERMSEGKVSAQEVAEALKTATSKGGPFYKGMENGAKTVSGRISTLKDNFMILIGKLTESLLPTFEKVVDYLSKIIEKFSKMSPEQREHILKWAGIIAAIGPVLTIFGKLTTGFGGLFDIMSKVKGAGGIAGLITKFGGLLPVLGSIIGPIAAAIGILALLTHVLGGPKKALDKLKQAFSFCKDVIQGFLDKLDFGDKIDAIKKKLQPLSEKLKGLKDLFKVLAVICGATLVPAITLLSGLFGGILKAIQPAIDYIGYLIDLLSGIGEVIVGIFTLDGDKFLGGLKKVFGSIVGIIISPFKMAGSFISGFFEGIGSFFGSLLEKLGITQAFENIKIAISNWWQGVVLWWQGIWNSICSFFGTIGTWLHKHIVQPLINAKNKIIEVVANIKDGIIEKFNTAKNKVSSIFNSIKNFITEPIRKAKDKVGEYINSIKNFFTRFTAKIKLPHFSIKNASLNPVDWIKKGIPKIAVDWYAKAMDSGMILDEPTIFGMNKDGQLMGAGEKGSETVVGTNSLMSMIKQSVSNQNYLLEARIDTLIEILLQYLPILVERKLCLDSGEIVGALTPLLDKSLGDLSDKKGRGR